jgi:hypothetical protein
MLGYHLQLRYDHFIQYSFQLTGVAKNTAHRRRWGRKQTRIGWSRCSGTGFPFSYFLLLYSFVKKKKKELTNISSPMSHMQLANRCLKPI